MLEKYPQHFTFAELTHTVQHLPNAPQTWEQVENLRILGVCLDNIRREFDKPIRVNCAFRSPDVNRAVGGVKTSAHLDGLAADICAWSGTEADNRLLLAILEARMSNGIDQLISYHKVAGNDKSAIRFIHVGFARAGQVAREQRLYK